MTRDLWRVFGHSNYPPHLAYRQYRHTSSSRQICDILNSTDLFLRASLIRLTKGANNYYFFLFIFFGLSVTQITHDSTYV